ncbi:hypothetical protein [Streptomyces sp. NRRL F-5123]|uniref:hypothetical protein n=1 Tax=Streptomyces sp. NRRL F-5123 TaxID=1463856 RepID=UPI0004E233DA|nr:hypothetical protein [Streptomyces sp. NRRL F-5123]
MKLSDPSALLVLATVARVFIPDARALTRALLRTGVRVGAAALLEEPLRSRRHSREPLVPAGREEEA